MKINKDLKKIKELLTRFEGVEINYLKSNANFFYNDFLIEAYYQIKIKDFDYLSLPINDHQIELLLDKFSDHVISSIENDSKKGRICELPSSLVEVSGRLFEEEMQVIENACKEKLGIEPDYKIIRRLSKIVIYEKDCKTLPIVQTSDNSGSNSNSNNNNDNNDIIHSNNNNNNNNNDNNRYKFATLVLVLPSTKSKGCDEFLIKHNNLVISLNIPNISPSNLRFFTFFNDCLNKMKSISDSYRVCLVYDLIKTSNIELSAKELDKDKENQIKNKIKLQEILERLGNEINLVFEKHDRLIYVLDRQYKSFSQILKLTNQEDKTVTQKLILLKEKLGYSIYLTCFRFEEVGSKDSEDMEYSNYEPDEEKSNLSHFLDQNDLPPITRFGIDNTINQNDIINPDYCNRVRKKDYYTNIDYPCHTKSYLSSSIVIINNKTLPSPSTSLASSTSSTSSISSASSASSALTSLPSKLKVKPVSKPNTKNNIKIINNSNDSNNSNNSNNNDDNDNSKTNKNKKMKIK